MLKPVSKARLVSGHDFSRAEQVPEKQRALAPEGFQPRLAESSLKHFLRSAEGGVTLAVRALPGAKKKTAIVGTYCEGEKARLKIAVQAPPIDGRANSALVAFLSETFGLPKSHVELVSGELSRSKAFLLRGVTLAKAQSLLAEWQLEI